MHTQASRSQVNKSRPAVKENDLQPRSDTSTFHFVDNRPEAAAQRKLQGIANNSPQIKQATRLHELADNHSTRQRQSIQKKENSTGLKTGIENVPPVQRAKKNAAVAWNITHIVEQTDDSLFGGKNALANELRPGEGGQLERGDKLIIDDAPVLMSRRGSNQEDQAKRTKDETGTKAYEWVRVLKVIRQDGSKTKFAGGRKMYVRKETIAIEPEKGEKSGVFNDIELHNIEDWDKEGIPDKLKEISSKWHEQGRLRRTKSKGVISLDEEDMRKKKRGGRQKPSGRNWDEYDEGVNVATDMAKETHEPESGKRQWRIKAVEKNSGVLVGVLIVEERHDPPFYLRWMIGNPEIRGGGVALLSAVKHLLNRDDTEDSIEVTSAYSAKTSYTKSKFKVQGNEDDVTPGEEFTLVLSKDDAPVESIPEPYKKFKPEVHKYKE